MPSKRCPVCRIVVPSGQFNAHREAHRGKARERQSSSQRLTHEMRNRIVARDGGRCVICGNDGPDLQVHHKDGNWRNNEWGNLETRCGICHPRGQQKARSF